MLANQSEDCLYLNLYVPKLSHGESSIVRFFPKSSIFSDEKKTLDNFTVKNNSFFRKKKQLLFNKAYFF